MDSLQQVYRMNRIALLINMYKKKCFAEMKVKSCYQETKCCTCLSLDRNLKTLKTQDLALLEMLCPVMSSYKKQRQSYHNLICWECEYMLIKIRQFQTRVTKAQYHLMLIGVNSIVDSLSSMTKTEIETIDIPPPAQQVMPMEHYQQIVEDMPIPQPEHPTPIVLAALKVDPETIKIDEEEEDNNEECDGDYDELIPTTKIEPVFREDSTDSISTPKQKTPRFSKIGVAPAKHPVTATDDEHRHVKVFIKPPDFAPRGCRSLVKVTGGAPNLVPVSPPGSVVQVESVPTLVNNTYNTCVPTMIQTSEGFSIVVQDTDSVPILGPNSSTHENPLLNIVPIILNHDLARREQTYTNNMNLNAQF